MFIFDKFWCLFVWSEVHTKRHYHAQLKANSKLPLKCLFTKAWSSICVSFSWHSSATVPLNVPVVFIHIFVHSSTEVAVHLIGLPTVEICNMFLDLLFNRFYVVSTKTTLEFHLASHWVSTAINVFLVRFFKWIKN